MKNYIRKDTVILFLLIYILLVFIAGSYFFYDSTEVFFAKDLPTTIDSIGESRRVDEVYAENSILTYGPYISVSAGKKIIKIYYTTTTDKNEYEIYSHSNSMIYKSGILEEDNNVIEILLESEEIFDLEVRTIYNYGILEIYKIEITEEIEMTSYFIFCGAVLLVFIALIYFKDTVLYRNSRCNYEKKS